MGNPGLSEARPVSDTSSLSPGTGERPVLLILPRMHGFFSLVFQAVGQAHLAEKAGQVPVVYFNRHCPYWSDAGYQGARNVWTYFFEPLSDVAVGDLFSADRARLESGTVDDFQALAQGSRVVVTDLYPDVVEYFSPLGVNFDRNFVHGLMKKFVRLKPALRAKVDDFHQAHFGSQRVLGVHYRGIEKTQGAFKDGVVLRRTPGLKQAFLREMGRRIGAEPGLRVFVATDSVQFLEEAKDAFGEAVFCREARRLESNDEAVGLHFSAEARTHGPMLAEEVLLDALLLARTDFLIHGVSNVSNAALFLNPRLRHLDIEVKYGRTRIYLRREFYRQLRKRLPRVAKLVQRTESLLRRH